VGARDERRVVVKAEVAAPLVVVEPKLALQLPVVELDRPAQTGEPGEPLPGPQGSLDPPRSILFGRRGAVN
jgi:hypothetical protein